MYSIYGLNLSSDFLFANQLSEGVGLPNLSFQVLHTPPVTRWEERPPVYASLAQLDDGQSLVYLYRQDGYEVLQFTGVVDYYLWPERIVCHVLDANYEYLAEIYFLGIVFSLWLELRGVQTLHASAVVVEDRAAAFLATNSGGKSSLAATLMQAGCPLLTDDVLPVERPEKTFRGRPGYPQMRMWPDQAEQYLGYYEDLDIVHPAYSKRRVPVGEGGLGTFCKEPQPLACLYLPERRDPHEWGTEIKITGMPRVEGLMALVGQSFASHLVEALGLQPQRLGFFASLVTEIPMRRIIYPEGYEHLPEVRRSILNDLADLQPLKK